VIRDPSVMYQPWLAQMFPGVTMRDLNQGYWTLGGYVAMADLYRGI